MVTVASGIQGFVERRSRVFGAVWLALVFGAICAAAYAFLYGPLVILGYVAAPLAVLAAVLSVFRHEREGFAAATDVSVASVSAWWVFGSAVGGFIGGLGYVAQFTGELILFGGLLGLAQWVVLRRYLRRAGFWVVASIFGWIVAQIAVISIEGAFPGLVDFAHRITRDDVFAYALFDPFVWAIYGSFQAILLLAVLRRTALPWLLPWILASASGGVFEAVAMYLEFDALLGVVGGGFEAFVLSAVYQSVVCALYGILTGLVLYTVLRRASVEQHATEEV
ncbi:hypothetical protein BH24ACT22_BH24ACT22_06680 [soil metagenome]